MIDRDAAGIAATAQNMRASIIRMLSEAGSGHPGGSLSAADIVATLFFGGVMAYDESDPTWPGRDRFILCKGHAAPVLYAALAELGWIPPEELLTLRKMGSRLQGHPDSKKLPGVEVSTGSLGQGLSIAAGLALGLRLSTGGSPEAGSPEDDGSSETGSSSEAGTTRVPRVYALLGDGELEEGQIWEAAMFASHYRLGNLIAIVDNNGLQIDGDVTDVAGLTDIAAKFSAFGWRTIDTDGHDIPSLLTAFRAANAIDDAPVCIVARTVKGKGVSFMEGEAGWHGKAPSAEEARLALEELEAAHE